MGIPVAIHQSCYKLVLLRISLAAYESCYLIVLLLISFTVDSSHGMSSIFPGSLSRIQGEIADKGVHVRHKIIHSAANQMRCTRPAGIVLCFLQRIHAVVSFTCAHELTCRAMARTCSTCVLRPFHTTPPSPTCLSPALVLPPPSTLMVPVITCSKCSMLIVSACPSSSSSAPAPAARPRDELGQHAACQHATRASGYVASGYASSSRIRVLLGFCSRSASHVQSDRRATLRRQSNSPTTSKTSSD